MDLWILDQYKEAITKTDCPHYYESEYDGGYFIGDGRINGRVLGVYKSEERCKEIILEIAKRIENNSVFCNSAGNFMTTTYYEMPEN